MVHHAQHGGLPMPAAGAPLVQHKEHRRLHTRLLRQVGGGRGIAAPGARFCKAQMVYARIDSARPVADQ